MLKLIKNPKLLHKQTRTIDINKLHKYKNIMMFMQEYINASGALGLHAVQLGKPYNIFLYDGIFYINTKYASCSGDMVKSLEGCLSIPDKTYVVHRFKHIKIYGYQYKLDSDCDYIEQYAQYNSNPNAIILQHEIDHSYGITIDQIGVVINSHES